MSQPTQDTVIKADGTVCEPQQAAEVIKPVAKGGSYTVTVKAPADCGTLAYLVDKGAKVDMTGINLSAATVAQEAGNLNITLPNGCGNILLLDFVAAANSKQGVKILTDEGNIQGSKLLAGICDHSLLAAVTPDVAPAAGPKKIVKIPTKNLADIEPAAGEPAAPVDNGGFYQPGEAMGTGVSNVGVFSSVIGPFGIPVAFDAIKNFDYPVDPAPFATPVTPPPPPANTTDARNDSAQTLCGRPVTISVLGNDSDIEGDAVTITGTTNPAHGSITVNANGSITYTPVAHYTGIDSFTYTITDARGATDTATITINVTNTAPDAVNDARATAFNTPLTVNVLANDTDADGDVLDVTRIVTQSANGTAVVNADNTITFTPANGFTGTTTFTYEVVDTCGLADIATVTVTVNSPTNTPPDAVNDVRSTHCGTPVIINVLANDTDPNSDTLSVTRIVSNPAHGSVTINANGTITYTPVAGYTGEDFFQYEISDGHGGTDVAQVKVVVTNNPPDAVNDASNTAFNTPVTLTVLSNDTDPDAGDVLDVTRIVTQSPNGTAVVNANNTITFTPNNGFTGTTTFTYEVIDECGLTDIATVTVTVSPQPNNTDAVNDTVTTTCVSAVCGCGASATINVLANDTDAQGDTFTVTSVGNPAHGSVFLNADGTITYRPEGGFTGTDSFTYTITDARGATDTATVNITVTNEAPVAADDVGTTPFQTPVTINLMQNDFDPSGGRILFESIQTNPAHGTLSVNSSTGVVVYTPNAGFTGTDTFTYRVQDGCGMFDTATVTITVGSPPNDTDARNDSATTHCGNAVTISVLSNDVDTQGDTQAVTAITQGAHGSVTVNANGTVTYTPVTGFTGIDTFTYTITDARGATDTATVSVNVVNTPPDAVNDARNTAFNTPVTIAVLANDVDTDSGNQIALDRIVTGPANGTAVINPNGTITYTPNAGFSGTDTFTYQIDDSCGATDIATVTVTVAPQPNTTDARNDSATTHCGTAVTLSVLGNDVDAQGDAIRITGTTNPAHGSITVNANGTITYTPVAHYTGTDTFTYTITDARGATDTATVTINVVNAAPDAVNDIASSIACNCGVPVIVNVLANDTDADAGDVLDVTRIVTGPAHGVAVLNANNTISYTPFLGFSGSDTLTYEITDECGLTDIATVTFNVTNTPPDARNDSTSTHCGTPVTVNILANDSDAEGIVAFHGIVAGPAHGTAVFNANGTITYTPGAHFTGIDTFTYEVIDSCGATDTATVTINVVNAAPDAVNDICTTNRNTAVVINVLANDTDADAGDVLDVTRIVTQSAHGTATVLANNTIQFVPANGFTGTTTFQYEVVDECGLTDIATVTVTVRAPVTPPDIDCPLVIDLNGNGLDLLNVDDSTAMFDMNNDGVADRTAWVGEQDGLLAMDRNNDGQITSRDELFGNTNGAADGFARLSELDSNGDNTIDASDDLYSALRIWVDGNSDGVTNAGELQTLAQLGVQSISLDAQAADYNVAGQNISAESTVTFDDGSQGTVADVWFHYNPTVEVLPTNTENLNG